MRGGRKKPITFACREILSQTPEEIADQILDLTKWPEFRGWGPIPGIRSAEFETRTPSVVGSRIRVTNLDGSTHVEEIVEWQPDRRIQLRMGEFSRPLSRLATGFVETWEFERIGGKTKAVRSFQMNAKSVLTKPVLWVISFFLKRAIARHLRDIMPVIYSAVKRFDPACGESWQKFVEWSGLTHLQEVVSLDLILCPTVFQDLTAEDWRHNVQEDFKITLFHDLDHVLHRVAGDDRLNVLALMQNPTAADLASFADPRFVFWGFDLVELQTGISALVNCGGFDKAFAPTELSDCDLLADHARALAVQERLRAEYPDEHHADCDVWAIWQLTTGPESLENEHK